MDLPKASIRTGGLLLGATSKTSHDKPCSDASSAISTAALVLPSAMIDQMLAVTAALCLVQSLVQVSLIELDLLPG